MVVQVVQHHRPLDMVPRPPGDRRDLFLKLLDQALLVRRDDVHHAGLPPTR